MGILAPAGYCVRPNMPPKLSEYAHRLLHPSISHLSPERSTRNAHIPQPVIDLLGWPVSFFWVVAYHDFPDRVPDFDSTTRFDERGRSRGTCTCKMIVGEEGGVVRAFGHVHRGRGYRLTTAPLPANVSGWVVSLPLGGTNNSVSSTLAAPICTFSAFPFWLKRYVQPPVAKQSSG